MRFSRVGVSRGSDVGLPCAGPRLLVSQRPAAPLLPSPRDCCHHVADRHIQRSVVHVATSPDRRPPTRRVVTRARRSNQPRAAKVTGKNDPVDKTRPRVQRPIRHRRHPIPTQEREKSDPFGANIPWGVGKIVEVMVLWLVSFVVFRSSIWRMGLWFLGIASEAELSAISQAAFTLFLDFVMLWATVGIIWKSLEAFRPIRHYFPFRLRGRWWLTLVVACVCIPLVDWLGTHMTVWFPEDLELPTHNVVVQLSRGDLVPNLLYFILLSMCAPLWEEVMFRGFLLQSLGKLLPVPAAILVSSAIFAVMHGNLRQFLPLWVLGMVIGKAFVQTRNLLPAILLHSFYNCYVFAHVLFGGG